jgi:tetratricopeptide (TPR) repeat protein
VWRGLALALVALAWATAADAQVNSMRGKVVDALGKPVEGAEVLLEFVGNVRREFRVKTDKNGDWIQAGMPAGTGRWNVSVRKGDMTARINGVMLPAGEALRPLEIQLSGGEAGKIAATKDASAMAERLKKQAELEALLKDANADVAAAQYDAAIEKLTKLAGEIEKCALCLSRIGDAYIKKGDPAAAEKHYLLAIETDASVPDPYAALATLYNEQKKFDKAAEMSAKANELLGATGNPATLYNEGVILWNQGKAAEAQVRFEKAIAADPTMADAWFQLGMALVNQGKLPEAKKPFEEYLKLAPTGPNAAQAKQLLAVIK